MQLQPLYTLRYVYPQGWEISLSGPNGREEQHFYFAERTVDGRVTGTFRAANYPRRRVDQTFVMDMSGSSRQPRAPRTCWSTRDTGVQSRSANVRWSAWRHTSAITKTTAS